MGEQRIKTILMDCDGVLVDSEMIYLTSLVHYLKIIGVSIQRSMIWRIWLAVILKVLRRK